MSSSDTHRYYENGLREVGGLESPISNSANSNLVKTNLQVRCMFAARCAQGMSCISCLVQAVWSNVATKYA